MDLQFPDSWHDTFGAGYYFPALETHAEQILTFSIDIKWSKSKKKKKAHSEKSCL